MMYIQAECDRVVRSQCFRQIQLLRPDIVLARIPAPHLMLQREPAQEQKLSCGSFISYPADVHEAV